MKRNTLDTVLDAAGSLALDEREELVELLHKRTIEERRNLLASDIKASRDEFRRGKTHPTTVDSIMKEIIS